MIILIADDDRLVRFSLCSMLRELLGDRDDVFLQASNGKEMIAICREQRPDLVFADIRMPYVDGLEAIGRCQEYSPNTEFVIVSGYSDFQYAREGLRLGAQEYLLKPVEEEQLRPILEKVEEKLRRQKTESNSRFQLRVMNEFQNYSALGTAEQDPDHVPEGFPGDRPDAQKTGDAPENPDGHPYTAVLLYVRSGVSAREEALRLQTQLLGQLRELGESIVRQGGNYVTVYTGNGTPCLILDAAGGAAETILPGVRRISALAGPEEHCFHYFVWFRQDRIAAVWETARRMDANACLLAAQRPGSVSQFQDFEKEEPEITFYRQMERLLDAWETADGIACREIINQAWRFRAEKEPELSNLSRYCSAVCGCRISGDSLHDFFRSFVEHSDLMYQNAAAGKEEDVIGQIKRYIRKYYMNEIGIAQIAEHFGLTANYLSAMFHRRTGGKFIDYLTETRIEAAKKLLIRNPSASVQDIALMVGYNSQRHFSSLFQKLTGETPSAYRNSRVQ